MVGVPGRSKACHNCRNRRMRCDLGQPGCQNCAKSGRVCTGYYRRHAFVLSKDVVTVPDATTGAEFDSGLVVTSRWRVDPDHSNRAQALVPRPLQHSIRIPKAVSSCHAYRNRLFGLFLDHHFPVIDQPVPALEQRNWMVQILQLPNLTPGLTSAVLALCAAHIGHHNGDTVLVNQSLPLYARSLRELQQTLRDPGRRDDEQTLAATSALLLYEVSECPGNTVDGYMSHYNGFMELLRLRGPDSCKSGLAHSLFLVLRLHTMFQGLVRRSTSFLVEPSWKKLPWQSKKSHFDLLLDILLELPALYAGSDTVAMTVCHQDQLGKFLETIREAQRIESRLTSWLATFESSVNGSLYSPELRNIENAQSTSKLHELFPVLFRFPAFYVGQNVVYYWLGLLIVHAHLCFMYNGLERLVAKSASFKDAGACMCNGSPDIQGDTLTACLRHFKISMLSPLAHRRDWAKTTAYNICQSIDYFLQDNLRDFGPAAVIPALAVVKTYWSLWPGDWAREIDWTQHMFIKIKGRGSGIAGHF